LFFEAPAQLLARLPVVFPPLHSRLAHLSDLKAIISTP